MSFINIDMNMEELVGVKKDVLKEVKLDKIGDSNLYQMIFDIVKNGDYDIITCDEELINAIYMMKYDEDDNREVALGVYYKRGSERGKIFLCRDRIKKNAKKYEIDENEVYRNIFMHELGHHVFKFTNLMINKDIRRDISEGLANYFSYLFGNNNDIDILEKMINKQSEKHIFYEYFCCWEKDDRKGLNYALSCLISGEQDLFIMLFLKYLLVKKSDIDDLLLELINCISNKDSDYLYSIFEDDIVEKKNYDLYKGFISFFNSEFINKNKVAKEYIGKAIEKINKRVFEKWCIKDNDIEISEVKKLIGIISNIKSMLIHFFTNKIISIIEEIKTKYPQIENKSEDGIESSSEILKKEYYEAKKKYNDMLLNIINEWQVQEIISNYSELYDDFLKIKNRASNVFK